MSTTTRRNTPQLHPSADAISRVRNRAAELADARRRRDQHPDPDTNGRYQTTLAGFEQACDAARAEGVLANAMIQAAVRDAAGRPDRLGALLAIGDSTDPYNASEAMRDLFGALAGYRRARQPRAA